MSHSNAPHDGVFASTSSNTYGEPFKQTAHLSEASAGAASGNTTPLTHSLLDTMGYAHSPPSHTGNCPIATRLLYNYTQGTTVSLLNSVERQAIHQKAGVDSYEQAKSYIVSSLFQIKDESFRKVACCLVADYLGTQFLSQGSKPEPCTKPIEHQWISTQPSGDSDRTEQPRPPQVAAEHTPAAPPAQHTQQQHRHVHRKGIGDVPAVFSVGVPPTAEAVLAPFSTARPDEDAEQAPSGSRGGTPSLLPVHGHEGAAGVMHLDLQAGGEPSPHPQCAAPDFINNHPATQDIAMADAS